MQTSELEKKNNHLLGDEECINFRPSPNFKHMRKYLKSKFEECNSSSSDPSDPSTTPNSEEQENMKVVAATMKAQRVQPPLPPNSPPPDNELVVPKQEVVDDEYEGLRPKVEPVAAGVLIAPSTAADTDAASTSTATTATTATTADTLEEGDPASERKMCRQFARGTCVRDASACRYQHKLILSQLPGIYTFCKNFQNTVCNYPKCKFVHATVFEKEHFYRTGYLPPHTLKHLVDSNSALAPLPRPEGAALEGAQALTKQPPPPVPGVPSLATSGCVPVKPESDVASRADLFRTSPLKRSWSAVDDDSNEQDSEKSQKKCKNCDVNELRMQYLQLKLESLVEVQDDLKRKIAVVVSLEADLESLMHYVQPINGSIVSAILGCLRSSGSNKENVLNIEQLIQMSGRKLPPDEVQVVTRLIKLITEKRKMINL